MKSYRTDEMLIEKIRNRKVKALSITPELASNVLKNYILPSIDGGVMRKHGGSLSLRSLKLSSNFEKKYSENFQIRSVVSPVNHKKKISEKLQLEIESSLSYLHQLRVKYEETVMNKNFLLGELCGFKKKIIREQSQLRSFEYLYSSFHDKVLKTAPQEKDIENIMMLNLDLMRQVESEHYINNIRFIFDISLTFFKQLALSEDFVHVPELCAGFK